MGRTLNSNEIYSVLSNMIISQQTFANPIGGLKTDIVDSHRVDGTLYGDTKLYNSVDLLFPQDWLADAEAANLLALNRNTNIAQDAVTLDIFKMIWTTTDAFLTKRAFDNEGTFANLNEVLISMLRDTLKAYDVTTFNTFLGTDEAEAVKKTITVPAGANEALIVANGVADIIDDMGELSRDYNANGYLRAFGKDDIDIIFNNKALNSWKYQDLPIVFHKDGVLADHKVMNEKYFGVPITTTNYSTYSAATPAAGKPIDSDDGTYVPGTNNANGKLCSLVDQIVTVSGTDYKLFAGDELPAGAVVYSSSKVQIPCYIVDNTIVAILIGKGAIPYMSAAESSTAFFNPRSLTKNDYLIFGRNTLHALQEKPYVIVRKA